MMRNITLLFVCLLMAAPAYAEKKNKYSGLFGNYRRPKFVENEGNASDFGVNLLLSTMLPITPLVQSTEDLTLSSPGQNLSYSTFFNFETGVFLTLSYNWEVFLNLGYYNYETRKENETFTDPEQPLFHEFELEMIPVMLGVKYRMSRSDIVPYVGLGAGLAYARRKAFYDYNEQVFDQEFLNVLVAQALVGVEFFISSRTGLRLEASAYMTSLPARTYSPGSGANFPIFQYQSSPIAIRYSSGLFIFL